MPLDQPRVIGYQSRMLHAIQRNVIMLAGMVACGFVCVLAATFFVSPRGDAGPTMISAQSPIAALLALVVCIALASIIAGLVGRFVNSVVGMFVLGAGLFVLDGRLDTIRVFAFMNGGTHPRAALAALAIETLLVAAIALGATLMVFGIGGKLRDVLPDESDELPRTFASAEAMKSAAAGAITLIAVYFLAQSPMKGQVIGAVVVGGMIAGLAARLISPHVQPVLIFCSPIVFGSIGYLIAMVMMKGPLDAAYVADTLPALARPVPLDYAAGSLMGVAIGLGWARSFLHHEEPAAAAA
jgi:hypothetical protein